MQGFENKMAISDLGDGYNHRDANGSQIAENTSKKERDRQPFRWAT